MPEACTFGRTTPHGAYRLPRPLAAASGRETPAGDMRPNSEPASRGTRRGRGPGGDSGMTRDRAGAGNAGSKSVRTRFLAASAFSGARSTLPDRPALRLTAHRSALPSRGVPGTGRRSSAGLSRVPRPATVGPWGSGRGNCNRCTNGTQRPRAVQSRFHAPAIRTRVSLSASAWTRSDGTIPRRRRARGGPLSLAAARRQDKPLREGRAGAVRPRPRTADHSMPMQTPAMSSHGQRGATKSGRSQRGRPAPRPTGQIRVPRNGAGVAAGSFAGTEPHTVTLSVHTGV